jgi:AraC-like DNA-binding protein
VVFAESGDPLFSGKLAQKDQAIVFLLSGKQQVRFYTNGQLAHRTFTTRHVFFMDQGCPSQCSWKYPCQRLGIVFNNTRLGMSWNRHVTPDDAQAPDLWYQHTQPHATELKLLFDLMAHRRHAAGNSMLSRSIPRLILEAVAELLANEYPNTNAPTDHYRDICRYIDESLDQPIDRKMIASLFHLHPDYISRLFQRKGIGFSDYLESRRIDRARVLLTDTQLPINQVAGMCGYRYASYFIRAFRKHHHMAPGNYRKTSQ